MAKREQIITFSTMPSGSRKLREECSGALELSAVWCSWSLDEADLWKLAPELAATAMAAARVVAASGAWTWLSAPDC